MDPEHAPPMITTEPGSLGPVMSREQIAEHVESFRAYYEPGTNATEYAALIQIDAAASKAMAAVSQTWEEGPAHHFGMSPEETELFRAAGNPYYRPGMLIQVERPHYSWHPDVWHIVLLLALVVVGTGWWSA